MVRARCGGVLAGERRDAAISVTFVGAGPHADAEPGVEASRLGPTDVISFSLPGPDGKLAG